MSTPIILVGTLPSVTTGADTISHGPHDPASIDQNMVNLRAAVDRVLTAAGTSNTPAGNIAATTVQAAINELDTEKSPIAGPGSGQAFSVGALTAGGGKIVITYETNNAQFAGIETDTLVTATGAYNLKFFTNGVEHGRIDSSGNLLVGVASGSNHIIRKDTPQFATWIQNNHDTAPEGLYLVFGGGASPNNLTQRFLQCDDNVAQRLVIYSNGNIVNANNSYGAISDRKLKQDIVDAASQWEDIKALRFRKFHFKSDPTGHLQLGVIAQELEQTSPGLVDETPDRAQRQVVIDGAPQFEQKTITPAIEPTFDEEGNELSPAIPAVTGDDTDKPIMEWYKTGETTKSVKASIMYMKGLVALQEALNRIEQLESRLAALESA